MACFNFTGCQLVSLDGQGKNWLTNFTTLSEIYKFEIVHKRINKINPPSEE